MSRSHLESQGAKKIEPPNRKEPETITISEDDEEPPQPQPIVEKKATASPKLEPKVEAKTEAKKPEIPVEEELPIDLAKKDTPDADLTEIKREPLDHEHDSELRHLLLESLMEFSQVSRQDSEAFEALLKGIELHQRGSSSGLDMLCAITEEDGLEVVDYKPSQLTLTSRLDILYCVTRVDKIEMDSYVDPLKTLKSKYDLHDYHSETSAQSIQTFIQDKTAYFKRLAETPENCFIDDKEPPSLAKILKKIKNTEFFSDVEVQMRQQLIQLQDDYREKQAQLNRMKSPRKKFVKRKRLKGGKATTPKRGTPKKMTPKRRNSEASPATRPPKLEPSSPPRLQTAGSNPECWKKTASSSAGGALLKPPKLTASSLAATTSAALAKKKLVTNLSTINAKFMKGKANPFANLLTKLATSGPASTSGSKSPVKTMPDIDEEDEDPERSDNSESESEYDEYAFDDDDDKAGLGLSPGKRARSSSLEDSSSSKKRKADKPKKQSGTTETIVPKKPKNLFMMNCYEFDLKEDDGEDDDEEIESEDDNDEEEAKPAVAAPPQAATKYAPGMSSSLRDAKLSEGDLSDGLRLLILQEGRFWPAWLHSTQLPDVYGIVMEKQRGNRPQILPRDDILREAVSFFSSLISQFSYHELNHDCHFQIYEVIPENKTQLPVGTRVCVYWSRAYNCLFPGTIEDLDEAAVLDKDKMVQVLLDDGDRRQVEVASVRMLPQNYSHVEYDPDPIATMRKRRISADSVDSRGHCNETMHSLMSSPLSKPKASSTTSPAAVGLKHKHKKKRKHHHCKRKHKRQKNNDDAEDDSLKIKLDGSFNNTTTYSIRSPMYHHKSEESDHEDDFDESSESDSDGDTEQNKSAKVNYSSFSRRIF